MVAPGPIRPLFRAPSPAPWTCWTSPNASPATSGWNSATARSAAAATATSPARSASPTLDGLGVVGVGVHTKQEHLKVSSLVPRARLFAGLVAALADRNH